MEKIQELLRTLRNVISIITVWDILDMAIADNLFLQD